MSLSLNNVSFDVESLSKLDFRHTLAESSTFDQDQDPIIVPTPYDINCVNESNYWDPVNLCEYISSHQVGSYFLHLNIQCLPAKFDNLVTLLQSLSDNLCDNLPAVLALSETWLNQFNTSSYAISGFHPIISNYRKDNSSRGGVALFVHENLDYVERPDLSAFVPFIFESQFVTLKPSNITVGVVYRSPESPPADSLEQFEMCLNTLSLSANQFIILGDFNLNLLNFGHESAVNEFVTINFENGSIPLITKPTRVQHSCASCIDNILTNKVTAQSMPGILIDDTSDHFPVFHCLELNKSNDRTPNSSKQHSLNFSKKNLEKLNQHLSEIEWTELLSDLDPSSAATRLNSIISKAINATCSSRMIRKGGKNNVPNQPWFTSGLKVSCNRKKSLYKKTLKNSNRLPYYRKYRNVYNRLIKLAKANYYSNKLSDVKNNIKKTWITLKEIISKTSLKNTAPSKLKLCQKDQFYLELDRPDLVAEFLNNFFSTIGERTSESITSQMDIDPLDFCANIGPAESFYFIPTDKKEVIETTLSIKSKHSSGHDNLSNKIVKIIIPSIVDPLVHIFNLSLESGVVPDPYKLAKIIPIFKTGDKEDPNNYRPISLLTAFSKILEKLVYKRLIKFLLNCNSIYLKQYGFLRGRSTEHAMIDLVQQIVSAIERKCFSLGLFLDLTKAFDTISHQILLKKMHCYGIRGVPNDWFKSYLSDRQQYVQLQNSCSSSKSINFGVPQGSVLGPLLFLIYINDMPTISTIMDYILFADDTTALFNSASLDDLFSTVNTETSKLQSWFSANKLLLNPSKTNLLLFATKQKQQHFTLLDHHQVFVDSCSIKLKTEVKFLGLYLDENLNFKSHLNQIAVKITKGLYALRRASKILININDLKTLYSALILPYLNYGILIWGGSCNSDPMYHKLHHGENSNSNLGILKSVHNLQKRALRIVGRAKYLAHHIPLCFTLNVLDLQDLYNTKALAFFYDYYHGVLPPSLLNILHLQYTRSNNLIIKTSFRRTKLAASSLLHTLPNIWNPLPENIKRAIEKSKPIFLQTIKNHYISEYEKWSCAKRDCFVCKNQ